MVLLASPLVKTCKMNYKQTFSRMIQEGAFDKRLYHGIGHRRVFRHGIEQLRDATNRLVDDGKMSPDDQKELLGQLAQRIADRLNR